GAAEVAPPAGAVVAPPEGAVVAPPAAVVAPPAGAVVPALSPPPLLPQALTIRPSPMAAAATLMRLRRTRMPSPFTRGMSKPPTLRGQGERGQGTATRESLMPS